MIKSIFIRGFDGRLRFIWKLILIISVIKLAGIILGASIGYFLMVYFAITRGAVFDVHSLQSNAELVRFCLVVEQVMLISIILFFVFKIDKRTLKEIGINFNRNTIIEYIAGCFIGAVSMFMVAGLFVIFTNSGIPLLRNAITFNAFNSTELQLFTLYGLLLFFLVGFQEELLFRGYLTTDLRTQKPIIAVLVPSTLFALAHISNPEFSFEDGNKTIITLISLLNIFLVGIIFGTYFLKSKNILLVAGAHFMWNFVQYNVLGFNVSGLESGQSIMNLSLSIRRSHLVFTGGKIGPEGGIIVTLSLLFMALMLFTYSKIKNAVIARTSNQT